MVTEKIPRWGRAVPQHNSDRLRDGVKGIFAGHYLLKAAKWDFFKDCY